MLYSFVAQIYRYVESLSWLFFASYNLILQLRIWLLQWNYPLKLLMEIIMVTIDHY